MTMRFNNVKKQGYGDLRCQPCGVFFPTFEAMMKHKTEKRASDPEDHVHCRFCGIDFVTDEAERLHIQEFHPQKQNLQCPGCDMGPFTRLAGLIEHIEKGHCPKISGDTLDNAREKKMEFAKKLVALTNEPLKHDFSSFLHGKNDKVGQPKASEPAKPLAEKVDKWPRLSEAVFGAMKKESEATPTNKPTSSSGTKLSKAGPGSETAKRALKEVEPNRVTGAPATKPEQSAGPRPVDPHSAFMSTWNSAWNPKPTGTTNETAQPSKPNANKTPVSGWGGDVQDKTEALVAAWSEKKNLFPDAPAASEPDPGQLEQATAPSARSVYESMDPHHPSHPQFNASRYYSELLGKYACPQVGCMKCFKNARALTGHLLSVHGDVTYNCPYCFKKFYSLTAVAAHAESSSQRCNIRESDAYGAYVDQLTAGLVDVSLERYDDGTNQYVTTKSAKETFGIKKGPGGTKHVPGWE